MTVDVAIIGFGAIGQVHARLLALDRRVRLAGVVEPDPERARLFGNRHGGQRFKNLAEALDAGARAVVVASPNLLHEPAVLEALERGAAVFCEKPLATSVDGARRIAEEVRRRGGFLQVGHSRRFAPAYRVCHARIEQGFRPISANFIKNDADLRSPAWSADPAATGGLLYDGAIHALDAALSLLGPVAEVHCLARSAVYADLDNLSINLRFTSGAVAALTTCGHASGLPPLERVAIYGDHAALLVEDLDRVAFTRGPAAPVEAHDFRQLPYEERWGYAPQARAFVDALVGGGPPAVSAQDGLRVIELIDACYRSAGEKRPVLLVPMQ